MFDSEDKFLHIDKIFWLDFYEIQKMAQKISQGLLELKLSTNTDKFRKKALVLGESRLYTIKFCCLRLLDELARSR